MNIRFCAGETARTDLSISILSAFSFSSRLQREQLFALEALEFSKASKGLNVEQWLGTLG